jgi:hypothetical protein
VYVFGVVFARQLVAAAAHVSPRAGWHIACRTVVVGALIGFNLHGLHLFATTNSMVRTGTYFGPDHREEMLNEAERLLSRCHLYFVNLDSVSHPVVHVKLYEPGHALGRPWEYSFLDLEEGQTEIADLRPQRPLCFLHLVEGGDDRIMQTLRGILPGGTLLRRRSGEGGGKVLYTVYFYGSEE